MNKADLSELNIKRVYSATTIYTNAADIYKRSRRTSWAILYKWEGETVYKTKNGETVISNAKHPVILPKGSSYEWQCTKAGRYSVIEFDAEPECEEIFSFNLTNEDKLLAAFKKLERTRLLRAPCWQLEVLSDTYRMMLMLLRLDTSGYVPSDKLKKIQPAIDYMLQNFDTFVSNDELAAMTSVSTVYFRKIFTEAYGMSPIRYVQHVRIAKAKEMLRSDFGSISDIAQSLGYQSIYHFSKAFKTVTGMSPSAYMKEHQTK